MKLIKDWKNSSIYEYIYIYISIYTIYISRCFKRYYCGFTKYDIVLNAKYITNHPHHNCCGVFNQYIIESFVIQCTPKKLIKNLKTYMEGYLHKTYIKGKWKLWTPPQIGIIQVRIFGYIIENWSAVSCHSIPCMLQLTEVMFLFAFRLRMRLDRDIYIEHANYAVPFDQRPGKYDIFSFCIRAYSRFVPSQWETALLCNHFFHWLGASIESALYMTWTRPSQFLQTPWHLTTLGRQQAQCWLSMKLRLVSVVSYDFCWWDDVTQNGWWDLEKYRVS